MILNFFRAKDYSNFGDELNPYIFNHIFPELLNNNVFKDIDFYGIGSIIDSRISKNTKAVIFGTGVRDITIPYNTINWDIRFLRGPISSNTLGFNGEKYIADAAYCMLCEKALISNTDKKTYKFSLMPHYRQMDKINWDIISDMTGIHIIDPRKGPKDVIQEIAKSEKILTIAMHGAIVADILRVPWLRIKMEAIGAEHPMLSDIKWLDFLLALDLKDEFIQVKNFFAYKNKFSFKQMITYYEITKRLRNACNKGRFQLTEDRKLLEITEKLNKEIQLLKDKYK